jgi:hypothetical protein
MEREREPVTQDPSVHAADPAPSTCTSLRKVQYTDALYLHYIEDST